MPLQRHATSISLFAALTAAGCASTRAPGATVPDYTPPPGRSVTPVGELYAGCVREATSARRYDISAEGSAKLLRFTCTGAPARQLYVALSAWSASHHSEWTAEGRTWRSTSHILKDLFGTDYCSTDGASDYACAITLNVGDFLTN